MTKHHRETKDSLKVIGILMKTTNSEEQCVIDIPRFWEKFHKENVLDRIPNKKSKQILALYTDYEGDYTQPYNYMICCEVTSLDDVPPDMTAKIIPPADYTILKAQGKFPEMLNANLAKYLEIRSETLLSL